MEFEGIDGVFYEDCLAELQKRPDFNPAYIPILERYVFVTMKMARISEQISDQEAVVQHTNKAGHTNEATSPHWRMYLALNKEAIALGKELKLSPASAPPVTAKPEKKKGFDLSGGMKVA